MDFSNLSSQDWQRFSYFALILSALIVSVASNQNFKIGKVLKYLAIWAGFGLALIVLYSYRYEFSDFKNRILREINPAAAQLNREGQIIISASQDGHFYINASVNGETIRFMIDTGASDIALNPNDAVRIGVNLKTLLFNRQYQTANGMALGASINLGKFVVGNIKFNDLPASVSSGNMGVSLLGMSFLKRLKKYEFYQNKLALTI